MLTYSRIMPRLEPLECYFDEKYKNMFLIYLQDYFNFKDLGWKFRTLFELGHLAASSTQAFQCLRCGFLWTGRHFFFSQNNSRTYVHNSTCRWLGAGCQIYKVNKIFTSSHITKITTKHRRGNRSWRAVRGRLDPQESGYYPFIPAQPWGVLLSPCTAHIPAELCDLAGGKLSVGMEHQPLCIAATQAEIYDHSSKNWGVAEGKTMVVMQDANSAPVQQDCCTDHRGFLSAPPTAQTCIKLAWPWPWPRPVLREVDGLGVILKLRLSGNMVTL